jgi:tetratricopeptide (TPR) repeat protein
MGERGGTWGVRTGEILALDRGAKEAVARKDRAEAVRLWSGALALLEASGDASGMSTVLHAMAEACADADDFQRAFTFWERALELDRRLGNVRNEGVTLMCMVTARAMLGDARGAMDIGRRAIPLVEQSGDLRALLAGVNNLVRIAKRLDDRPLLDGLLKKMLDVSDRLGDKGSRGLAQSGLASLRMEAGEWAAAQEIWRAAHETFQQLGKVSDAAGALANLGIALAKTGDFDGAMETLQRSLTLFEELGDTSQQIAVLELMMQVARQKGDKMAAVKLWSRVVELGGAAAEAAVAGLYGDARSAEARGDLVRVGELITQMLELCSRAGDTQGLAVAFMAQGRLAYQAENWADAVKSWNLAVQNLSGKECVQVKQDVLSIMVQAYAHLGDVERAFAVLEDAKQADRARGVDPKGDANGLNAIAKALLQRGNAVRAVEVWQQAFDEYMHAGLVVPGAGVLNEVSRVQAVGGEVAKALATNEEALKLLSEPGMAKPLATVLANRGNILVNAGNEEAAIACWRRAAEIQVRVPDDHGRAISLANIGNALLRLGRPSEAMSLYQQALPLFEKFEDEENCQKVLKAMSISSGGGRGRPPATTN